MSRNPYADTSRVSSSSQTHSNINQHYESANYLYPDNLDLGYPFLQCLSANSILHTAQFAQGPNLFDPEPPIDFFDIPLNSTPPRPHAIPPGLPHGYSSVITPEITFDTSAFPTQTGQYQVQLDYTYSPQDHILGDTPLLPDTPGIGVWPATVSYSTQTQPHHGVSALLYQLRDELNLLLGPPTHSGMFTNPSPPDPVIRARSDPVDQPPNHLPRLVLNPEAQHHELENFPASGAHPLLNPPESPLASTSQTQMAQPQQQPASGSESSSVSGISPAHGATEDPENYCTICGKSFRRPYVFEDHMRAHTGEASPYRCEFEGCAKVYHNRSNLLRHLKAHSRVGKTRNRPQKNDEQVPDDTSEQRPAAGPSTHNAHNSMSTHRPDQVVLGSGNVRFRPYETPDSVRHKVNKRKKIGASASANVREVQAGSGLN